MARKKWWNEQWFVKMVDQGWGSLRENRENISEQMQGD